MGGDWQQLLQSVIIGLIFSFLLAKLISFVTAFRDENLSLSRASSDGYANVESDAVAAPEPAPSNAVHLRKASVHSEPDSTVSEGELSEIASRVSDDNASVLAEKGSVTAGDASMDDVDSDDDDWEGVESTELDEAFSAATAFIAASAADKIMAQKVGNDAQLQLYGLYKIATEGPCSAPPPPAFKLTARAKWNAWQKMGAMPPEDAMQKYVEIVTELFPSWLNGAEKTKDGSAEEHGSDSKGPMGPVFSSFIHEEEPGVEMKMDAIHAFAREGDVENMLKCIENGISPNSKDSEGRTPLHWAVDRGHLPVIDLLYGKDADINAKDNEGQTALHYAVVCDREAIAEYLVKHNASVDIKDNDGASPSELCEKNWPWMRPTDKVVE